MEISGLIQADAAIVGGDLLGLLLAAALSSEGLHVVVLECQPASCETGIATLLNASSFAQIGAVHGLDAARQYASALMAHLQALTDVPLSYVQELPAYVYARHERALPVLKKQQELLTALNIPVQLAPDAGGCPFPVELSLLAQGQAVVNIRRWQSALRHDIRLQGSELYRAPRIVSLDSHRICTSHACVEAPHIILTTDIPLGLRNKKLLSLLNPRLLAHCELTTPFPLHSCQLAVEEDGFSLLPTIAGAVAIWDAGRLGTSQQQEALARFDRTLESLLPDWQRGDFRYSQIVATRDGLPIIGALPGSGLLCAAGLGWHGVLGAMHAADVLSRRILGHASPQDGLYAPQRKLPKSFQRQAMRHLTGFYAANMIRRNAPACAHCHCRMRYSIAVQRWECPYCGTCYTMLGQPICGPGIHPARVSVRQRPDI